MKSGGLWIRVGISPESGDKWALGHISLKRRDNISSSGDVSLSLGEMISLFSENPAHFACENLLKRDVSSLLVEMKLRELPAKENSSLDGGGEAPRTPRVIKVLTVGGVE